MEASDNTQPTISTELVVKVKLLTNEVYEITAAPEVRLPPRRPQSQNSSASSRPRPTSLSIASDWSSEASSSSTTSPSALTVTHQSLSQGIWIDHPLDCPAAAAPGKPGQQQPNASPAPAATSAAASASADETTPRIASAFQHLQHDGPAAQQQPAAATAQPQRLRAEHQQRSQQPHGQSRNTTRSRTHPATPKYQRSTSTPAAAHPVTASPIKRLQPQHRKPETVAVGAEHQPRESAALQPAQ